MVETGDVTEGDDISERFLTKENILQEGVRNADRKMEVSYLQASFFRFCRLLLLTAALRWLACDGKIIDKRLDKVNLFIEALNQMTNILEQLPQLEQGQT